MIKHEWFLETVYPEAPHAITTRLTEIEDDDREVFAVLATPVSAIVISRRPRPAPPEPAVGGGSE